MSTNNPMTQDQLDEIQARVDAVGPVQPARHETAPYEVYDSTGHESGKMGGYMTYGSPREVDAEFITHAYTDVPALLAEVERLTHHAGDLVYVAAKARKAVERLQALTTVDDEMVERAEAAHREAFNAWQVKRSPGDSDNRRVDALRAALNAALNTQEDA